MQEVSKSYYAVRNVELYHPRIWRKAVRYFVGLEGEIIIETDDGTWYSFDEYDNTARRLPESNKMTEEECMYEFSFRLRRIMYRKGITQEMISERTGIARPLISRYMNGKSCPSFYKVDKIAKAIGCSIEDLRLPKQGV